MIRNYFAIMFRSMTRRKFHTAINVLCLTVGITFAMVIGLFIHGELEVNQSLKEVDRLFLVENKLNGQATGIDFFSPPILSRTAVEQYPAAFAGYYRFWDRNITVSKGDEHFRIQSMIGDPSFVSIFGFKVLHGDEKTPLHQPDCIIITEDVAKRFFNKTDVVGETLSVSTEQNGIREYRITAVIAEPDQKNSVTDLMDMNAQVFLSLDNVKDFLPGVDLNSWQNGIITYVRLTDGIDQTNAENTINTIFRSEAPKNISENRTIELIPLSEYYLVTNRGAVMKLILSLTVIVIFILVLAITNFINISIASSFSRLKEVGVRKAIGGSKKQLVVQFLSESVTLATLSGLLSVILYQVLHPMFNNLLSANLPSVFSFKPEFCLWLVAGVLLIGLMAGVYPAFFQSAAKPIESLKGKSRSLKGTLGFSRMLITTQFVITIFVLTGAIVLSKQTTFFMDSDLGFKKSNVLIVSSVPRWWNEEGFQKMEAAKTLFLQSPDVRSVSLSWGAPGWGIGGGGFDNTVYKTGSAVASGIQTYVTGMDESFDDVFGLTMLEGSFIMDESSPFVPRYVTLNESASNALKANVGEKLRLSGSDSIEYTVAGIVKNFNYESMHQAVKPVLFMHSRDFFVYRLFSFRMNSENPAATIAAVERLWKKVFPSEPFTYFFAEERVQALYTTELQLKKASSVATILMVIMVVTGLLGLVSLNVSKRNKEIGIRKVLGASVPGILIMLSKEYARLMIVAVVIAIPVACYFANAWLGNFVYHIDLAWWIFVLPGALLMLVTIAIVSAQSYQTASTDPVKSLRYE